MDAVELRETVSEALASDKPVSAETLNMACFWMSTALDSLRFSEDEAAAVARRLLRVVGRILIDAASREGEAASSSWSEVRPMVLLWIDEALRPLGYEVKPQPGTGQPELPDPSADWS